MQSLNLLPELCKLPTKSTEDQQSFKGLIADIVNSDLHSSAAEFDEVVSAQAEIEKLTKTGSLCEIVEDVNDAFSILGDYAATDRATRLKLNSIRALRPLATAGPALALQMLTAPLDGGISFGILDSLVGFSGKVGNSINKRFDPKRLGWALKVTGLAADDLFYFKNKSHIDDLARRFQETAQKLTSAE